MAETETEQAKPTTVGPTTSIPPPVPGTPRWALAFGYILTALAGFAGSVIGLVAILGLNVGDIVSKEQSARLQSRADEHALETQERTTALGSMESVIARQTEQLATQQKQLVDALKGEVVEARAVVLRAEKALGEVQTAVNAITATVAAHTEELARLDARVRRVESLAHSPSAPPAPSVKR